LPGKRSRLPTASIIRQIVPQPSIKKKYPLGINEMTTDPANGGEGKGKDKKEFLCYRGKIRKKMPKRMKE
jgi:hypothetical protein